MAPLDPSFNPRQECCDVLPPSHLMMISHLRAWSFCVKIWALTLGSHEIIMKKSFTMTRSIFSTSIILASFLILAAPLSQACNGSECFDKNWLLNDLHQFNRTLKCTPLNDEQSLKVAEDSIERTIDYDGFKSVYQGSCDLDASISAATIHI